MEKFKYLGWTMMNYHKKKFILCESLKDCYNAIPAPIRLHKIFIDNFVLNGKKWCMFKDMKVYADFNGNSKMFLEYGYIKVDYALNNMLFPYMNKENVDYKEAIENIIFENHEQYRTINKLSKNLTEEEHVFNSIKNIVSYIKKSIKNIDSQ